MAVTEALAANLLSPVVLAFALGIIASLLKSDLELPEPFTKALSIYLLLAIGLKGGAELSAAGIGAFFVPALVTVALGLVTPITAFLASNWRVGRTEAAALAAHYGSVSAVTFIVATTIAQGLDLSPEGFLPALVALLEVPAIIVGILLFRMGGGKAPLGPAMREIVAGRSVLLLVGGLVIGALAGPERLEPVEPVFVDAFQGALLLFLLELGLVAGARLKELRGHAWFLIAFGTLLPVVHGALGVWAGGLSGLGVGGAAVLGAMVASASYIAAPAAIRVAIPEANPSLYLGGALGITFPFNVALGIPLYIELATLLG